MRKTITNGIIIVCSITNLNCGDDSGGAVDPLGVEITSPTETVYTKGDVTIQVAVNGGLSDRVDLLRDGEVLVTLAAPYQYTWNTTGEDEGNHQLVARAYAGDTAFESSARTVIVDRTPPTFAERTPLPGDDEAWVRAPIRATFSEPVLAATVGDDSITVWHETGMVPATPSLSVDALTLTITPLETPVAPDTISIELHPGITDLAGNELELPADNWTFIVPTWLHVGEPLDALGAADTNGYRPILRLDATGAPVVAWSEDVPGSGATIQVARWNGSLWAPFAAMDAAPAANPSMALDPGGTPVLAWSKYDVTEYDVRVERWTGSDWSMIGDELGAFQLAYAPSVQTDSGGATLVAWYEYSSASAVENVYVSRFNSVTWDPLGVSVSANSSAGTHARYPSLAVGPDDRTLLAWSEIVAGEFHVYVAEWLSDDWPLLGTPQDSIPDEHAIEPVVVFDGSDPLLAWSEGDTIQVRSWSGTAWVRVGDSLLDGDAAHEARSPALAVDTDGSTLAAWTEWSANSSVTRVARFTGTEWVTVGDGPLPADGDFANDPALAVSQSGDLYVAFDDEGTSAAPSRAYVLRLNR
jgi:hypothetical protein